MMTGNTDSAIPFNKPSMRRTAWDRMQDAMARGHISGAGYHTERCEQTLKEITRAHTVLLTTSCTHALEMSALLLDIQPGDEVILPSYTFVSTANAFVLRGAIPRFVDIRPDTLNLDETLLEAAVTARTRAIVPVHYAGVGCEMDALEKIANRNNLQIVEDNAHGLTGHYREKPLGSFGALGTLSFHETKNFHCGEGGALLINNPALSQRAEIIREKGTDRSRFFRGEVDKYSWVDVGSSYIPADLLASFLSDQLDSRDEIQKKRQRIWEHYDDMLRSACAQHGFRQPVVPEHCNQAYHMYYLLAPNEEIRSALIKHMKNQDILAVHHYVPLHDSLMGRKFGYSPGDFPVTEDTSNRLVRLPFFNDLNMAQQDRVIEEILAFFRTME